MIPRGALKAFGEMLKDHKSTCKKLAKGDETHLYIEIDDEEMESIGEHVYFRQPKFKFKELHPFFEQEAENVTDSIVMSGEIENAMHGFAKSKQVDVTYRTMGSGTGSANLIHFKQEETNSEAVFICPAKEIKKEEPNGKQEEF
jgi:hypothetical protein